MMEILQSVQQGLRIGEIVFFSTAFLILLVLIITFYVKTFWR